jgi:GNAT superfamily N-acetyltransferase
MRTQLRPGDIGAIVQFHGLTYGREYGFDHTFEAYVAGPLADFACRHSERERIWIAERDEQLIGCIAIVEASPKVAQLRWFLVDASARGAGLGKRLLIDAIAFCRRCGYESVILWTVRSLTAAAHLYAAAGFCKVEEKPGRHWGVDVVEERYELNLPTHV